MGRINTLTGGAFTEIVGNQKEISKYDEFINYIPDEPSKDLKQLKKSYKGIINENKGLFEKLSVLEELILQLRSRDEIINGPHDSVKLSIVRDYIYARCPFYRKGMKSKDIRVIVDKTEFWGEDTDKLFRNKEFMDRSYKKLVQAMSEEIEANKIEFKRIYK